MSSGPTSSYMRPPSMPRPSPLNVAICHMSRSPSGSPRSSRRRWRWQPQCWSRTGGRIVQRLHESPYLTRFPASLDPSPFPTTRRFRERADARSDPLPDWWEGDASPLVFISFGTVVDRLPVGAAAYRAAVDAVAGLPVRVLLTMGRTRDAAELGALPVNVHLESWVPQDDVLQQASVVVCHGGAGTTFGALAAGLPLVVVPMMADQPANARLVGESGAGLVVEPVLGSSDVIGAAVPELASRIRGAIEMLLGDPSYRQAATRIAGEFGAMPVIDEVLAALSAETLTTSPGR